MMLFIRYVVWGVALVLCGWMTYNVGYREGMMTRIAEDVVFIVECEPIEA